MKKYIKPEKKNWGQLTERTVLEQESLRNSVREIINDVRRNGDKALKRYTKLLDGVDLGVIQVSNEELNRAEDLVSEELKKAIDVASENIRKFHTSQREQTVKIETMAGVECWRESRGIEKVGLYIPGGTAPLFSSVLMLVIPASLAGCKEIVLCTPPQKDGTINPAILYAAKKSGATKVYKVGGAQAVGAMAFGTQSVDKVNKIFGPGNQFVTMAKEIVQQYGVAIDMPAGPSEVLVIGDETSNPAYVAADLLSQAEHGKDSQVVFLTNSEDLVDEVQKEIVQQLKELPRKEVASEALKGSFSVVLSDLEECIEFSNQYAPEHLILAIKNASSYTEKIENAGSVFLGNYSCESVGDYASGTNHTLPTNGYAASYSGVSLDSFLKKITFQNVTEEGLKNIGPVIELMAEAEELYGHKNAVSIRLNKLK